MSSAFTKLMPYNSKSGQAVKIRSQATVDQVHKEGGGTAAHHKYRKQDSKSPDYYLLCSVTQNGILLLSLYK